MTENPSPSYDLPPARGEAAPAEACRLCGGIHATPRDTMLINQVRVCLPHLREQIGTLQGEVLALRLQLAAREEPQTAAEAAIADAAQWGPAQARVVVIERGGALVRCRACGYARPRAGPCPGCDHVPAGEA